MDEELVSAVKAEMGRHLKAEVMDDRAAEIWAFVAGIDDAARAVIPMVLEHAAGILEGEAKAHMIHAPDYQIARIAAAIRAGDAA